MENERNFEYHIQLVGNDFNEDGVIKPYVYQNMIQYAAECHLKKLRLDTDVMAARQLAWVLAGMTIEAEHPPAGCVRVAGQTWHSETKGPYFRREFIFFDDAGQVVFRGASFSVLIDLCKRSVLRKFTLPAALGNGNGEFVIAQAKPNFREAEAYDFRERRKVRNSDMDLLGHVNNTRYCEFAYDALSREEKSRAVKGVAVNFAGELQSDETVGIYKGIRGDAVYIKGVRESDGKKSFDVAFTFA
ncbi:MAG: hypothetical protein LBH54_02695 [Clostridiales bacterium]|jgi:acyl-CoA thioesterase FadM|nr:hypothetical protein [Clostridiales bacterium]